MPVLTDERSTLTLLAKQIEREIRTRGLREGDRFMTTEEVGQMLGVVGVHWRRSSRDDS